MPGLRWTDDEYAAYLARQGVQKPPNATQPPRQGKWMGQAGQRKRDASVTVETVLIDRPRYKSKTEARFVQEIAEPLLHEGKIKAWYFEPCKGLYLCARTSYTPDFLLWMAAGQQVFVEVKGALIRAKDWEKTKFAAKCYPCWQFELWQWKGGHWRCKQVPNF